MLKKILLCFIVLISTTISYGQQKYWQQEVNVVINVSLNEKDHSLDAFETIEYINHSPDTLRFIWFHLWPNAYKNDRTAFSDQLLKSGRTDFYFAKQEQLGYINKLDFKADNIVLQLEADSANIDVVKLILPTPLPPGKKTIITTPFHVKLPFNFSRGGHIGNDYQVTQWFPKPAVYDQKGWHQMPYLDQGEFYSEFGNYDVEITVPSAYVVGATGILQDAKTLEQIKQSGKHTVEGTTKTWHFKQNKVHDFAWFASKDFIVDYDTAVLQTGKVVDVFVYHKNNIEGWKLAKNFAKDGLRYYSSWIGEYPYNTASLVQGDKNVTSGGMEYPTITLITMNETGQDLDATIVHELGHNWFYGALASNERQHPWMDEGMNTFYQKRYELAKYGTYGHLKGVPKTLGKKLPDDEEQWLLSIMTKIHKDQAIETSSTEFSPVNYGLIAYYKASRWMQKLEAALGTSLFDSSMHQYYNDWKNKHPYPQDFKLSIEKASGKDLNDLFIELKHEGPLAINTKKQIKPTFILNTKDTDKYNYLNIVPLIGYNAFDKIMPGVLVHNYNLPPSNFRFHAGAMYGTASTSLNGLARIGYTKYAQTYKLEGAISYINFTQNQFPQDDPQLVFGVRRIVPSATLTMYDKDANSTRRFTAQWKTFLINEEQLTYSQVLTPAGPIETFGKESSDRYINRLTLSVSDQRVLYPYNFTLSTDQGNGFIRAGFTGKYYFNYKDGKSGMSARLFAGKFLYTGQKTFITRFQNERYFLNMTGPVGREDYTYSDYFIGRNKFEGWMSQQIMERDGFFKIRTEAREIGNTDNWLIATNFVTDIPDKINPLRLLPFKIPFKIFVDIGTYAEAWQEESTTGRFIYDAGIQLPLFGSLLNVYIPLLYSKVYKDYINTIVVEKKFLRTISFQIDLQQLQLRKLLKGIPL